MTIKMFSYNIPHSDYSSNSKREEEWERILNSLDNRGYDIVDIKYVPEIIRLGMGKHYIQVHIFVKKKEERKGALSKLKDLIRTYE